MWLAGAVWRVHEAFDRVFERLRSAYGRLLGDVLDRPWLSAAAMLAFALGSLALFPFLGQDFFPAVDAGQFRLHVRAPPARASRRRRRSSAGWKTRSARSCPTASAP